MENQSFEDILKEAKEETRQATIVKPVRRVNKWLAGILVCLCIVNVLKFSFSEEGSFSLRVGLLQVFFPAILTLAFSLFASLLIALIPINDWGYKLRAYLLFLFLMIVFQSIFVLLL